MTYLRVRNWDRYQHYKTGKNSGRLSWIRLYVGLLRDPEFDALTDQTQLHALKILLLAAETDNKIPASPEWIGRQIGARKAVDLQSLLDSGFLESYDDPRNVLGGSYETARTEKNREEKSREDPPLATQGPPVGGRRPFRPPTTDEVKEYFASKGVNGVEYLKFLAHYEKVGWKAGRSVMVNWKAAVAGWILRNQVTQ